MSYLAAAWKWVVANLQSLVVAVVVLAVVVIAGYYKGRIKQAGVDATKIGNLTAEVALLRSAATQNLDSIATLKKQNDAFRDQAIESAKVQDHAKQVATLQRTADTRALHDAQEALHHALTKDQPSRDWTDKPLPSGVFCMFAGATAPGCRNPDDHG